MFKMFAILILTGQPIDKMENVTKYASQAECLAALTGDMAVTHAKMEKQVAEMAKASGKDYSIKFECREVKAEDDGSI